VTESSRGTVDLIVECLENEGVTHIFGIPGEENIKLVEAISRSSIQYVLPVMNRVRRSWQRPMAG
jgi:acetolactate synthase-1/2/3 large subunit